jgi:glycosyltransferase involved in cell wall biosynthesis
MAMGRPLIGPDHGGAAEMMTHEQTGLLFTPRDSASLAEAINHFYQSAERREQLATAARQHALDTFAVEKHAHLIQDLYSKLTKAAL